jgi:hypothetical protein
MDSRPSFETLASQAPQDKVGAGVARTEKGRLVSQTAFPVSRQLHIDGRFQNFRTGGLSPGRILIGSRCISGQSRAGARTDAMVSHLRKMVH